jgi:hypothetical protein
VLGGAVTTPATASSCIRTASSGWAGRTRGNASLGRHRILVGQKGYVPASEDTRLEEMISQLTLNWKGHCIGETNALFFVP